MSDIGSEIGPIDYLIVEWPKGRQPSSEALPELVDLADRGLIRVLDLALVHKNEDGSITTLDPGRADGDAALEEFVGASSGLLDEADLEEAGHAIEPKCSAAVLVYENAWARSFAAALRRSGAQLVANGRIPVQALLASLDQLEEGEA